MPHILPFGATEAAIKVNSQVRPAYFTKLAISLNCQLVCFMSDRALGIGQNEYMSKNLDSDTYHNFSKNTIVDL